MYYTIALLRYTSVEVRKVGGVAHSLVKHVIFLYVNYVPKGHCDFVCSG
jgi:hypothetical protein